ncbi:MAG: elongation factor G, partial [Proteobacteria bacterium]
MKIEKIPLGEGVQFATTVQPTSLIQPGYIKSAENGFRESAEVGPLASYSMIGLKGTLVSVEARQESSNEIAFKAAASLGFREAIKKVGTELLEPMFKLEVSCPDEFVGNIVGDLNSRRGKIITMNVKAGGGQIISAEAPLANLFGYATDVRSLSQGRASFSMEFLAYSVVPAKVKTEILTKLGR